MQISFKNNYIKLGSEFYVAAQAATVKNPTLIKFNNELANQLGIDNSTTNPTQLANIFSGKQLPSGAQPLAMAYAGHQFGSFNPQLGDGRALLLGEVESLQGAKLSLQLKGSGQTFFSRNGDGRAALGPVLREYLLSEAMHKLGVPTTRALACISTGEQVAREQLLPGGVITRVAASFIRVGSFQYFSARKDLPSITKLANYVIDTNYPACRVAKNPYVKFLELVVAGQASLIAKWMQFGFIHGVMNTDNMSVSGETIDYGPCAFMDDYSHDRVYSSIDRNGRYAYNQQPPIGLWNLTRLAESILPLLSEDTDKGVEIAQNILKNYIEQYENNWLQGMRTKLGLSAIEKIGHEKNERAEDKKLIDDLFEIMASSKADFTLTFYHLSKMNLIANETDQKFKSGFNANQKINHWLANWRERLTLESVSNKQRQQKMLSVNPLYIPRNHQIEAAIRAAEDNNDFSVFHALHDVLQQPFSEQTGKEKYTLPPTANEVVWKTFCGT